MCFGPRGKKIVMEGYIFSRGGYKKTAATTTTTTIEAMIDLATGTSVSCKAMGIQFEYFREDDAYMCPQAIFRRGIHRRGGTQEYALICIYRKEEN